MSDTTTTPTTEADLLGRLGEIRAHLEPVEELQKERLWILHHLKEQGTAIDALARADGSNAGAVRTSLSKARKLGNDLQTPKRYQPAS
jgi:hypothetical protein